MACGPRRFISALALSWQGLRSRSRRPHHRSGRYPQRIRDLVVATRQRLQKRRVGLSGPQAIQDELRQARLLQRVPSLATIKRILHDAGVSKRPPRMMVRTGYRVLTVMQNRPSIG